MCKILILPLKIVIEGKAKGRCWLHEPCEFMQEVKKK